MVWSSSKPGDGQFVGKPQADLLKFLGPPARTEVLGGRAHLIYEKRRSKTVAGESFCNGPGVECDGTGFPPPPSVTLVCDTIFAVSDRIAPAYDLRGFCG
jgi:hypothetical protein